jgi:pectinesterase
VTSGAYYLGRPWGAYARVVFQSSTLSSVINSAGWSVWSTSDTRTSGVTFGEYKNSGSGASGTRASFAKTLSAAVDIADVLGSSYTSAGYYDSSYM